MIDKKKMIKEYKESVQPMGIYQIRNLKNGKIFIGSSSNLRATVNRYKFNPEICFQKNGQLKNDFKQYGSDNFVLEIIDELEPNSEPSYDYTEDLSELEALWLTKMQPYGDNGYNLRKD
ncbi:MAG: GIY-YIG nuclease family protein [Spirochaetes bacterium]|nr:GIY-YIG nuclease family protein [Spirochaetota bacterium]